MKTKRILAFALAAALGVVACDDQTAPEDEGTVSFQVTLQRPPISFEPTPMPDFPVDKGGPVGSGPFHFASAGPGSDSSAMTPAWDSTAILLANRALVIDAVQVRLVGSGGTSQVVTMTQQGNTFVGTSAQLAAGTYTAVVVGTEGGLATYYAQQSITITGGDAAATVNLNPFVPTLQPFQSPTTFTSVNTVFTPVSGATGYEIEIDTDPAFPAPTRIATTGSPTGLFTTQAGLFYMRVRAENAAITAAQAMPSNVEAIEIIPDTTAGNNAGSALPVGTGVYDSLNILPAGDEDWFSINLSSGDALSAGVYTESLNPASTLDPTLTLLNSAGDTIAFNDNDPAGGTVESYLDAIAILDTDTYLLVVGGANANPTGYYELEITLSNAIALVVVTPSADTVAVAGDTTRLTATAFDGNNNPFSGVSFTWSSSNTSIATVDASGLVTTIDQGTATITALAQDGITAGTATVTALLPPIDEVQLDRDAQAFVGTGGSAAFTATALSGGIPVTGIPFTWFSTDDNVVTVDNAGNVTSAGAGQAAVGATTGGFTAYATVTVSDPEGTGINLFARQASGVSNQIQSVWGFTSSNFYAAGGNFILHYDGNSWSTALSPGVSVNALWGSSPQNVMAVGDGGFAARFDGTSWTTLSTGTTNHLRGLWGASPQDVFAVGDAGTILHFDGSTWTGQTSGVAGALQDVWANAPSDVYAVGGGGVILHYDGSSWSSMTSGTTAPLEGIWGYAPNSVYAVGSNATILHWDGAGWTPVAGLPPGASFTSVWGTGSSDVYVTGLGDNMHFNGTWNRISGDILQDIHGSTNPDVYGVGAAGSIMRAYRGATFQANAAVDTLVAIDDTVTVVVNIADSLGAPITGGVNITWESSDSSVALPNPNGVVTALTPGVADITAISPSLSDIFTITVYQIVNTVTMSLDSLIIDIGLTDTLVASPFDANGHPILNRATAWSSTNDLVASVHPDSGYVLGVETGGVVVSANVDGIVGSTTVLVPLASVTSATTTAGEQHACGLDAGGAAWCWGSNQYGQLGDGSTLASSTPVAVSGGLTFTALAAGTYHTCGVTTLNRVYCWGYNGSGQLGTGDFSSQTVPTLVTGGHIFVDIQAGDSHTCALTLIGRGWCWGANFSGQLGNGGAGSSPNPVAVFGGRTLVSIDAGSQHSCAVELGGAGFCWGNNNFGEFGDGNSGTTSTIPVAVSQGAVNFTWIRTGYYSTCALDTSGAAHCWGYNAQGQLGVLDNNNRTVPTAVAGGLTFASLEIYGYHTCAVTAGNVAYCWGYNSSGQIGDGTQNYPNSPSVLTGTWASVATGFEHSCGRATTNAMFCWGDASRGATGEGLPLGDVPQPVAGGLSFSFIQGGSGHSCGLTTANAPYCWGRGNSGQLGNTVFANDSAPAAVSGPAMSMLRSGGDHTCGIGVADSLSYCWGRGNNGQLGNASTLSSAVPVTSTGGIKWRTLDGGANHTCAIDIASGTPYCWGYNLYGQLGQGTSGTGTDLTIPSTVSGGLTMTSLALGFYHSCGVAADSTAYCWGFNGQGQLGNGTQTDASTPQPVSGALKFISLTAGYYMTCGIAADSTGYCWGHGSYNGTGTGTVSSPTVISGGLKYRQIESNMGFHTCGVTVGDVIYCWGDNFYGQLGTGGSTFSGLPVVQGQGLTGATLGFGVQHSCAVTSSNVGYCWGFNGDGQLGLNYGSRRLSPVPVTGGIVFSAPPPPTASGGGGGR